MNILIIFSTRPEAIKMAPLVLELAKDPTVESHVCVTGQHRQVLDDVLDVFSIAPDYDLDIMAHRQSISDITVAVLIGLEPNLQSFKPDLVLVHGDTATDFAAALAAFCQQIPAAHVEAGTGNLQCPRPEEGNRAMNSGLAKLHFVPIQRAVENLGVATLEASACALPGVVN